jgi:hypothetical protein
MRQTQSGEQGAASAKREQDPKCEMTKGMRTSAKREQDSSNAMTCGRAQSASSMRQTQSGEQSARAQSASRFDKRNAVNEMRMSAKREQDPITAML